MTRQGRVRRRSAVLLGAVVALSACTAPPGGDGSPPSPTASSPTGEVATVEPAPTSAAPTTEPGSPTPAPAPEFPAPPAEPVVVADNLDVPWGLAFLPDTSALVTLRNRGEVLRVRPGEEPVDLGTVPSVSAAGEGGLLGVAVSPDFVTDGYVFVYLTAPQDNRVLRMRLDGDTLTEDRVIVEGIPKGNNHNGGRLAFGPDGYLYVTTGEAGIPRLAQDLGSLGGKILRVDADGQPAPDNPFPGSLVYSYGHRNVQGIDWDERGRLWASEFGQNTWDELNLITPGGNYGWPVVEGRGGGGGFVEPLVQWRTDEASPSGIAVLGDAVYLAALQGESLWRVPLEGDGVGEPQRLLDGTYGRLRTVVADDAGALWLLSSNTFRGEPREGDDVLVRVDPATLG